MRHFLCDGTVFQELLHGHGRLRELTDRDRRTFHGDGRQYHIDTGAVRQTGIHDGIRLIDFTSGQTYDLLDHILQLSLILKGLIQMDQAAVLLNKDMGRPVNHDLGNIIILDDRVQQPQSADGAEYLFTDIQFLLDRHILSA